MVSTVFKPTARLSKMPKNRFMVKKIYFEKREVQIWELFTMGGYRIEYWVHDTLCNQGIMCNTYEEATKVRAEIETMEF